MESSQWENLNHLFCRNVSYLNAPQFPGVVQADLSVVVAIVLSFLLRFTDSNYPFGNFKLFLFSEKYIQMSGNILAVLL
jgi:hypothetical protein